MNLFPHFSSMNEREEKEAERRRARATAGRRRPQFLEPWESSVTIPEKVVQQAEKEPDEERKSGRSAEGRRRPQFVEPWESVATISTEVTQLKETAEEAARGPTLSAVWGTRLNSQESRELTVTFPNDASSILPSEKSSILSSRVTKRRPRFVEPWEYVATISTEVTQLKETEVEAARGPTLSAVWGRSLNSQESRELTVTFPNDASFILPSENSSILSSQVTKRRPQFVEPWESVATISTEVNQLKGTAEEAARGEALSAVWGRRLISEESEELSVTFPNDISSIISSRVTKRKVKPRGEDKRKPWSISWTPKSTAVAQVKYTVIPPVRRLSNEPEKEANEEAEIKGRQSVEKRKPKVLEPEESIVSPPGELMELEEKAKEKKPKWKKPRSPIWEKKAAEETTVTYSKGLIELKEKAKEAAERMERLASARRKPEVLEPEEPKITLSQELIQLIEEDKALEAARKKFWAAGMKRKPKVLVPEKSKVTFADELIQLKEKDKAEESAERTERLAGEKMTTEVLEPNESRFTTFDELIEQMVKAKENAYKIERWSARRKSKPKVLEPEESTVTAAGELIELEEKAKGAAKMKRRSAGGKRILKALEPEKSTVTSPDELNELKEKAKGAAKMKGWSAGGESKPEVLEPEVSMVTPAGELIELEEEAKEVAKMKQRSAGGKRIPKALEPEKSTVTSPGKLIQRKEKAKEAAKMKRRLADQKWKVELLGLKSCKLLLPDDWIYLKEEIKLAAKIAGISISGKKPAVKSKTSKKLTKQEAKEAASGRPPGWKRRARFLDTDEHNFRQQGVWIGLREKINERMPGWKRKPRFIEPEKPPVTPPSELDELVERAKAVAEVKRKVAAGIRKLGLLQPEEPTLAPPPDLIELVKKEEEAAKMKGKPPRRKRKLTFLEPGEYKVIPPREWRKMIKTAQESAKMEGKPDSWKRKPKFVEPVEFKVTPPDDLIKVKEIAKEAAEIEGRPAGGESKLAVLEPEEPTVTPAGDLIELNEKAKEVAVIKGSLARRKKKKKLLVSGEFKVTLSGDLIELKEIGDRSAGGESKLAVLVSEESTITPAGDLVEVNEKAKAVAAIKERLARRKWKPRFVAPEESTVTQPSDLIELKEIAKDAAEIEGRPAGGESKLAVLEPDDSTVTPVDDLKELKEKEEKEKAKRMERRKRRSPFFQDKPEILVPEESTVILPDEFIQKPEIVEPEETTVIIPEELIQLKEEAKTTNKRKGRSPSGKRKRKVKKQFTVILPDELIHLKEKICSEEPSPMMRIDYQHNKMQRIYDGMEDVTVYNKTLMKHCPLTLHGLNFVKWVEPDHHFRTLSEIAGTVPPPPMDIQIEYDIRGMIPLHLQKKYPKMLLVDFKEIRATYTELHRLLGIHQKFHALEDEEPRNPYVEPGYKFMAKTNQYNLYLKRRDYLNRKLFITHPLIYRIWRMSVKAFPDVMVEFDIFRESGYVAMKEFLALVEEVVVYWHEYIGLIWYPKVVKLFKVKKPLPGIPRKYYLKYVECAHNLIATQITELMRRTILNFLAVLEVPYLIPLIKSSLRASWRGVVMAPSFPDLIHGYKRVIDKIESICRNLPVLNNWIVCPPKDYCINVKLSEAFVQFSYSEVNRILYKQYTPVLDHIEFIDREFHILMLGPDTPRIKPTVCDLKTFLRNVGLIRGYESFTSRILDLCDLEYFDCAQIRQTKLIASLLKNRTVLIEEIITSMMDAHHSEKILYCNSFQEICEKAKIWPENTEQLMALEDYMIIAKTSMVEDIKYQMKTVFEMMIRLMEFTTVSRDEIDLTAKTVLWIQDIKPVFEEYNLQYEQTRFYFEAILQRYTENLIKELEDFMPHLLKLNLMDNADNVGRYVKYLKQYLAQIAYFDEKVAWIHKEEALLKFPLSTFPDLDEMKDMVIPFNKLLYLVLRWQKNRHYWLNGDFDKLRTEVVDSYIEETYKEMQKQLNSYKSKIEQQVAECNLRRFRGNTEDADFENLPAPMKLCIKTCAQLKAFKPYMTLVGIICNPTLTPRHWTEISEIIGFDITPDTGTSLKKTMDLGLAPHIDLFEIISHGAYKELALQQSLAKMKQDWSDMTFSVTTYKETGVSILSSLEKIQQLLDEHLVQSLTMRGSAFVKPFQAEVNEWYKTLSRVDATIEEWGKVQSQLLNLLPIFSSKDIVSQMPDEAALYEEVNTRYKKVMFTVTRDPRVSETAVTGNLLETLEECTAKLEKTNEGITVYLEKKRLFFPRFFFLSNDEMLGILSETKDPQRVQPHLRKCFEGIAKLVFDKKLNILAMCSAEGERVDLNRPVSTEEARGSVEKWLVQVELQMLASVRAKVAGSYEAHEDAPRKLWVQKWPGQVVLCVSQIYWTGDVHNILRSGAGKLLKRYATAMQTKINDICDMVRCRLQKQLRITLEALIIIDVHSKDVVRDLYRKGVTVELEFQWLAQLRYYWEKECLVRIVNSTLKYACEYLGNTPRLVITPLTDRCYRTLISAWHLHLNGAPEGPAGTGKTETTKDLAKAIAVQCVVFNCSDGLDYIAMGKFFKGLASTGAWVCFDEFNRIELEVLSVVAQQILSITLAIQAKAETFNFEGTELTLNPRCYICITMNPEYAGRSELPDNLKVLFRPVAMMVPDYALIGEISLYSYGYAEARRLSVKIVTLYRLCSEQLSSQNHYDYGMRAVKSVLTAACNLVLKYPNEDEKVLVLRAIIDINLPKFVQQDVPLFEGIISDLFPGIELPNLNYDIFLGACKIACKEMNLQPVESFLLKVIQTYEMMIVRHGFMLIGEPFAGKTTTLRVLARALTILSKEHQLDEHKVRYQIINPKAVTIGQLFGQYDPVTREWTDGIVSKSFRRYATCDTEDRKWVIFDGPVDATWMENMNTVLDDNKKLCLTSGEIISMSPPMSMIFEVMDLSQASPATVSRCGMIYMEPTTLGWEVLIASWLSDHNMEWKQTHERLLTKMFKWLTPSSLEFVQRRGVHVTSCGESNLVRTTIQIVEMLLKEATEENEGAKNYSLWIQAAFIFAGVWGFGGTLDLDSRVAFDGFYRELWRGNLRGAPMPRDLDSLEISIPIEGLLHDYYFQFTVKGVWRYWPEMLRNMKCEEMSNLQQILVPTVDTAKYQYMMDRHIKNYFPMLLTGSTGTGKSFYTQNMLMCKMSPEFYAPGFMTFTSHTSANLTQETVMAKLAKRKKGMYGPPPNQRCVIFVDDMNMPSKEAFGAQPPIELLRQYLDHGHWYNLKDKTKIYLCDILLLGAIGPPGGSRQELYLRFLRHFAIYSINPFSNESLQKIFTTVLLIGLRRNGFAADVMSTVTILVSATLDVYHDAIKNLRPTPEKSHYIFNLRDFSRVIQGCGLVRKESVENKKVFIRLWVHEILRVFNDRLIDSTDRTWLFNKLRTAVKQHFREDFDTSFDTLKPVGGVVTEELLHDLIFGNFMNPNALPEDKKYEEVPSIDAFHRLAVAALEEFNSTSKTKVDVILFRFALEHLSRVCRVLAIPGGSALLVGVGGSGRQTLVRLANAIVGHIFFQPEISNSYGVNQWRSDLKKILKDAGGLSKETTFLFTENQIKEEVFLQDLDSMLNSGEVPNLFSLDERQEIIEWVRLAAQGGNRNMDISAAAVFQFFITRCKQKLHLVLCFNPIGRAFRSRLRLYPSLVNCCTIDWYKVWPEDALEQVAEKYMQDVNLPPPVRSSLVVACKYLHVTARVLADEFAHTLGRYLYVTSSSYLDLIRRFTTLLERKQEELTEARERYVSGLDKLQFASEQIVAMKAELSELRPQLVLAAENSVQMMADIERDTDRVETTSEQVRMDEAKANIQAAAAQELKDECMADLAQAIPILEDAIEALNTLQPTDITLVKSMKNPPDAIKLVMAAVCVMREIKPSKVNDPTTGKKRMDYWGPSKKLLGDMAFLQHLRDYDKDNIDPAIMKVIRTVYLPNPDFEPSIVAKASSAAEGLCKWVIAMDMYDEVAKEVAPKKAKLEIAETAYNSTMALLEEKRDELTTIESQLETLKWQLQECNELMKQLEIDVTLCGNKLRRAEKLIGGLGGEKDRWEQAASALQQDLDTLVGDLLVSCGIITYLPAFSPSFRIKCLQDWRQFIESLQIPINKEFRFQKVLGYPIKIQKWGIAKLPKDDFSIDNAVIMDVSKRWPLIIDPQLQANKWIKIMEKENLMAVLKDTDPDYLKTIESCIVDGRPVLLENVGEELETSLDPVLANITYTIGTTTLMKMGETVLHYNPNFRLYITTKLRNPHYLPELFNKVTVINFAITMDGLEAQLLGIVVASERPELELIRQDLIVENAVYDQELKDVEDSILITLQTTKGNILEDEKGVEMLDSSKTIAQDIFNKQAIAKETQTSIDAVRSNYRRLAEHSAVLYYSLTDLPSINPMYQYSLVWFIDIFNSSMVISKLSPDIERRMDNLIETFNYNLYHNICRSLFEKDKFLFSCILCTNILLARKKIDRDDFNFLLTGGVGLENPLANPAPQWLSTKSWDELCRLQELPTFSTIVTSFTSNLNAWKAFYDLAEPETAELPQPWDKQLTGFQKLMIIRVFRLDKLTAGLSRFIETEMGIQFLQPPVFDIRRSYNESTPIIPLLFILSPGLDPIASLTKFAKEMEFSGKFASISLGQGQGPRAEAMVKYAQFEGHWVCLQNCHLAVSWMPKLEKICEEFTEKNTHKEFRFWLTSYPSDKFPVFILQNSVKMTNEPPTGLQQNLMRAFLTEPACDPAFFEGCMGKERPFERILFGICFFHAVVQERLKFGPIGFNIPYEFNDSDFHISCRQLQMLVNQYDKFPLEAIRYMIGECNYGGRVTDHWDRQTLNTILYNFANQTILEDRDYIFACNDEVYGLPKKIHYHAILDHVGCMPAVSSPEVYGLHVNAGMARDVAVAKVLLGDMLTLGGKMRRGSSKSDHLVHDIASDILAKLPNNFNIKVAMVKYPIAYNESMNSVLVQEMDRFNNLLSVIRSTLQNMQKAVKGLIVMTSDLEAVTASVAIGRVPVAWSQVSYPSLKPLGSYIFDFLERLRTLQSWYDHGKPTNFWLSGFFFTQAFLTGAMQNHARKYTIPIDQLVFDFTVLYTDRMTTDPEDGVYCWGVFLDGARWDREKCQLDEQFPKVLWDMMPLIWFIPTKKVDMNEGPRYKCPLYRTSERRSALSTTGHSTNFVIAILLNTEVVATHWTKRGLALICQKDD